MKRFAIERQHPALALSISAALLVLSGCGGGGGGGSPTDASPAAVTGNPLSPVSEQSTLNSISGVVHDGVVQGGTVTAYQITNGLKGAALASSVKTDTQGRYSIDIRTYSGPVLVEVTGGTYVDQASGDPMTLDVLLRAASPSLKSGTTVIAVTPYTELAVRTAEASGGFTQDRITQANGVLKAKTGFDPVSTLPADATSSNSTTTAASLDYAVHLAGFSKYAADTHASRLVALQKYADFLGSSSNFLEQSSISAAIASFLNSPKNKSSVSTLSQLATITTSLSAWTIVDLGTIGHKNSSAVGINNSGQIIGYGWDKDPTVICGTCDAFMSDANGANVHIIGTPGTKSSARFINNKGAVVILSEANGTSYSITGANGAGLTALDASISGLFGLNDAGQYVADSNAGLFITEANGVGKTFLNLPVEYGPYTIRGFNNSGQLAGHSFQARGVSTGPVNYAFFTGANGTGFTQITSVGNNNGSALAINDAGQVVVFSNPNSSFASGRGSFVTGPNGVGLTMFRAYFDADAMNNSGGYISNGSQEALINGTYINLSSLPAATAAGWANLSPAAINDYNQIVGTGTLNGSQHAFLLNPPQ